MPTPPVTLNLLQLLPGDDQQTHTDKINYNFDQVLSLGGGPPGYPGTQGIQGVPGTQGLQGFQGTPGTPGSQWYVQGTAPMVSPAPNIGDFWFNTSNLGIYEWDGSAWINTGTLSIAGLFKESAGDTNRVVFTNTTALKSLVLSPIDYGVGSPNPGSYKLKLIGSSGNSIMNFGVDAGGGLENPTATQPYISIDTVLSNVSYGFNLSNPAGPVTFSTPGTSIKIIEQAANVSNYEFNGGSMKLQVGMASAEAFHRNIGFAGGSGGSQLMMHVGLQDAVSTPASRGLSVIDQIVDVGGFHPLISLRNATSAAYSDDSTSYPSGIYLDAVHPQLKDVITGSTQLWNRFRTKLGGTVSSFIGTGARKYFNDPGNGTNPERSTAVELFGGTNNGTTTSKWHSIGFFGGAVNTTQSTRPQLRITPPSSGTNNLIMVDVNGNTAFGDLSFIQAFSPASLALPTNVNIQGPASTSTEGLAAHAGLHFIPGTGAADRRMGISAGFSSTSTSTIAGVFFKKLTATNTVAIELNTGGTTLGSRNRMNITGAGLINFVGRNNTDGTPARGFNITFDVDPGATVGTNDGIANIYARDTLANSGVGMYKDIILQPFTDATSDATSAGYHGGGFVGIGTMTSNLHGKPQTKLHVKGAVTFGTRATITNYTTNVSSSDNWTFGNGHANSANKGMIIGGTGHTLGPLAVDSVIIGYSGTPISVTQSGVVSIPTRTSLGLHTMFWNSVASNYTQENNLSIPLDGQDPLGVVSNGIELKYGYITGLPVATTFSESAAFLVTHNNGFASDVHFVVRGDGKVGVMNDVLSGTDPVMASSAVWSITEPDISIGNGVTNVTIGMINPTTATPVFGNASHITTASRNSTSTGTIRGKHLMFNPGITRNINTGGSASAVGSYLYIRGGRGEKNVAGSPSTTTYGSVIVGYDLETGASANADVEVYGNAQVMRSAGLETITPSFAYLVPVGTQYITNTGQSGSTYDHVAVDYDRYVTIEVGVTGGGTIRMAAAVEISSGSGTYYVPEKRDIPSFAAMSFLVPADCKFRVSGEFLSSTYTSHVTIYARKFGK